MLHLDNQDSTGFLLCLLNALTFFRRYFRKFGEKQTENGSWSEWKQTCIAKQVVLRNWSVLKTQIYFIWRDVTFIYGMDIRVWQKTELYYCNFIDYCIKEKTQTLHNKFWCFHFSNSTVIIPRWSLISQTVFCGESLSNLSQPSPECSAQTKWVKVTLPGNL